MSVHPRKRLLFYDDADSMGGHEVIALRYLRRLACREELEILFLCPETNRLLREELEGIRSSGGNLGIVPLPFHHRPLPGMIPPLALPSIVRAARTMRALAPDVVVVLQGSIEISSIGLMASRLAGCRTVSYLPLAQSRADMGASWARLRDAVNGWYYRLPDRFVAISERQAERLRSHGVPGDRISVVPNHLGRGTFERLDRGEARRKLGLDPEAFIFGVIGRLVVKQKGQDVLIRAIARLGESEGAARFLIVGDGPDRSLLAGLASGLGVSPRVDFLPWQPRPDLVYSSLDAMVLPSLFEGVPLVMLEGVYYGIPVLASAIEGVEEYLPRDWLFPPGDADALGVRIREALEGKSAVRVPEVRARFEKVFFRDSAPAEFLDGILA
jgi:glycosyltransferase involved in cell wall biosynthesis